MKTCQFALLIATLVVMPRQMGTAAATGLIVTGRSSANVSIASSGDVVAAVWSASLPSGETDIYAAMSRDAGGTFSAPVRVNTMAGDARVNGEQPPRVTLVARGSALPLMTVVWTSKGDLGMTILSARSDDGGRTFSASALVPGGEAAGNRGWENAAADARGNTRVVWLDHRDMVAAAPIGAVGQTHAGHTATTGTASTVKRDGAAMAQQSKLYISTIGDQSSPRAITGGVCYCCKTAIVPGPDGAIYLAWRHVYPGNLRDMAFTASRDGGRTFAPPLRVSEDHWELDGCPDDGPAMAVDSRNRVHIAWPTLVSDGPGGAPSIGIFYATSAEGRAFSVRQRMPTEGLPHHPQVVVSGGRLLVAWDELKDGARHIVVAERPLNAQAGQSFARVVVGDGAPGLYPSLAATLQGAIVAWTSSKGQTTIQIARVP